MILDLQKRHSLKNVPSKYLFDLQCCYKTGCIHPPKDKLLWYPGGPPLSFVLLPSPDFDRPFRQDSCSQCDSDCSGHYLKPEPLKQAYNKGSYNGLKPPSEVLLSTMKKLKYEMPDENKILQLSKEVLLSTQETTMWCDHLRQVHENRVRGARKRAQKNAARRKTNSQVTACNNCPVELRADGLVENEKEVCFKCGKEEPLILDESDNFSWVCCDGCNNWYHSVCSGTDISQLENWLCLACCDSWDL